MAEIVACTVVVNRHSYTCMWHGWGDCGQFLIRPIPHPHGGWVRLTFLIASVPCFDVLSTDPAMSYSCAAGSRNDVPHGAARCDVQTGGGDWVNITYYLIPCRNCGKNLAGQWLPFPVGSFCLCPIVDYSAACCHHATALLRWRSSRTMTSRLLFSPVPSMTTLGGRTCPISGRAGDLSLPFSACMFHILPLGYSFAGSLPALGSLARHRSLSLSHSIDRRHSH